MVVALAESGGTVLTGDQADIESLAAYVPRKIHAPFQPADSGDNASACNGVLRRIPRDRQQPQAADRTGQPAGWRAAAAGRLPSRRRPRRCPGGIGQRAAAPRLPRPGRRLGAALPGEPSHRIAGRISVRGDRREHPHPWLGTSERRPVPRRRAARTRRGARQRRDAAGGSQPARPADVDGRDACRSDPEDARGRARCVAAPRGAAGAPFGRTDAGDALLALPHLQADRRSVAGARAERAVQPRAARRDRSEGHAAQDMAGSTIGGRRVLVEHGRVEQWTKADNDQPGRSV